MAEPPKIIHKSEVMDMVNNLVRIHETEKQRLTDEITKLREQVAHLTQLLTERFDNYESKLKMETETASSKRKLADEGHSDVSLDESQPFTEVVTKKKGKKKMKKSATTTEPQPGPSSRPDHNEKDSPDSPCPTEEMESTEETVAPKRGPRPPPIVLPRSVGYTAAVKLAYDNDIEIRAAVTPDTKVHTQSERKGEKDTSSRA